MKYFSRLTSYTHNLDIKRNFTSNRYSIAREKIILQSQSLNEKKLKTGFSSNSTFPKDNDSTFKNERAFVPTPIAIRRGANGHQPLPGIGGRPERSGGGGHFILNNIRTGTGAATYASENASGSGRGGGVGGKQGRGKWPETQSVNPFNKANVPTARSGQYQNQNQNQHDNPQDDLDFPREPPPPNPRNTKAIAKEKEREKRDRMFNIKEKKMLEKEASKAKKAPIKQRNIYLNEGITMHNLCSLIGVSLSHLQRTLERNGFKSYSAEYVLNSEIASLAVLEYNMNPIIQIEESTALVPRPEPESWDSYPPRPAVVTIMGHVDHGKTTLLDSIRKTSVVSGEAGGITQHIGAFSVLLPSKKKITFLDTPGHEAFTKMRQRGAQVTDIVVLVVAADDGIMPQTVEAIQHALKAQVPIIVAINKCDKMGIDTTKIKQDLLRHEIVVEEMGGEVPAVHISGKTGLGLADLEETILAISEVADFRGDLDGPVEGIVIESKMSRQFGSVATIIVKRGTLKPGALLVAGNTWCRVKRMRSDDGSVLDKVTPSEPAEILGWKELPVAGDLVLEAESENYAKRVIATRNRKSEFLAASDSIDEMNEKRSALKSDIQEAKSAAKRARKKYRPVNKEEKTVVDKSLLRVIIKGDVHGSVEAIEDVLHGLPSHEVRCEVSMSGVGTVTESDIEFARITGATIFAFNVPVNRTIQNLADDLKVNISPHTVIYTLVDKIKEDLSELLEPEVIVNVVGEATVQALFNIKINKKKEDVIAGCKVLSGKIMRQSQIRIIRDEKVIHTGNIKTFKHHKKDILEASKGLECGINVEEFSHIRERDKIQAIATIFKKRVFEA